MVGTSVQGLRVEWSQAYLRFANSPLRQWHFINRALHKRINDRLRANGYADVRMAFIEVIPFIESGGTRLTDLVALRKQPKATMARLINSVHQQGLIEKRLDPNDSRSKTLFLSERGRRLVDDAYQYTAAVEEEAAELLGTTDYARFADAVNQLFGTLGLRPLPVQREFGKTSGDAVATFVRGRLQLQLNAICKHLEQHLLHSCEEAGFGKVGANGWMVLSHITLDGTRMTTIAACEHVSKQSISDISYRLLKGRYIRQVQDPSDRRAQLFVFSERGKQLIGCAMQCLQQIEEQCQTQLSAEVFESLLHQSQRLFFLLGGELLDPVDDVDWAQLDPLLEDWLSQLLTTLSHHPEYLPQLLQHKEGQYSLRPQLLRYLQRKTFRGAANTASSIKATP